MIRPLFKNILIEETPMNNKVGSLFAPAGAQKFDRGVILAVGEEVQNMKPGDTVLFTKRSAAEIYHIGKLYLCMNGGSVYGVETQDEEPQNLITHDFSIGDVDEKEAVEVDFTVEEVETKTEAVIEESSETTADISPSESPIKPKRQRKPENAS